MEQTCIAYLSEGAIQVFLVDFILWLAYIVISYCCSCKGELDDWQKV